MAEDRVPLFVRLPQQQAVALDRLVEETGRRKQHVVSELLGDRLSGDRIELARRIPEEVLTLEEVASLLRVPAGDVRARAEAGDMPGRRFGEEWRFVWSAVLGWLGDGRGEKSR